jgi:uncharacterized membrane protein (DUF485 family)
MFKTYMGFVVVLGFNKAYMGLVMVIGFSV